MPCPDQLFLVRQFFSVGFPYASGLHRLGKRLMNLEWDDDKRRGNFAKHDVDMVRAARILNGPVMTREDGRNDYGEERYESVGYIGDDCFVVVWTKRGDVVRLISARQGGRRDRKRYLEGVT